MFQQKKVAEFYDIAFMYGDEGIRCNAICPGGVATNIGMGLSKPSQRGSSKVGIGLPLMNRAGDPIEIASTAVFLSCDDPTYNTAAFQDLVLFK
ncbi:MAG: SDR family oxidoreductase [Clostridiales bacterium]|nr:SDR family oxidoreductase [Clostridiales bacterium]